MIKLGVDVYGYLYLAGLFPSLYHYVVHGFKKRNFMVDSFLDYQGNVSSSSVDLYLGLLHRLPDWSFQLWWWSSTWHTSPALSTDLGNLVDSHFWIPQMVNFSHENVKYIFILKARSIYENWTGNLNVAKILQPYVIETYAIEHVGTDSWGLMLVARIPFPSSRSQGALSLGRLPLSSPPLPYPALPCPPPGWEQSENQVRASDIQTNTYARNKPSKRDGFQKPRGEPCFCFCTV